MYYGTAEIVTDAKEGQHAVHEIGEGHFFGEIGVVCNGPVYTSIR